MGSGNEAANAGRIDAATVAKNMSALMGWLIQIFPADVLTRFTIARKSSQFCQMRVTQSG